MKKIVIAMLLALPLAAVAQVWEVPDQQQTPTAKTSKENQSEKVVGENPDAPYLAGAVPEEDGHVVWKRTYHNDWDAETNYTNMLEYFTRFTKQENQLPGSHVALVDKNEHNIVTAVTEWLVFKNTFLALDRTQFDYTVLVECSDKVVNVKIFRLIYTYEAEREGGMQYKAEGLINDENALNKSRTKLYKKLGKFRRKTVDRMNEILDDIAKTLNSHE